VPALAGAVVDVADDGDDDDDDDEPAVDGGFVVAEAAPGAPFDRKASGAVVPPGVEAGGVAPVPP
jgi:hypothetical protein